MYTTTWRSRRRNDGICLRIPINLEYHNDDFIQEVIADRVDGIAAINEDRKMRNIALALNNEEIMNKIMENEYPNS